MCLMSCAVISEALNNTPQSYYTSCLETLSGNAKFVYEQLSAVPQLQAVKPRGAMYIMIGLRKERFADIKDDMEFTEQLMREEGVFVLPACIFQKPDFFRLVVCPPRELLATACQRIAEFCKRHDRDRPQPQPQLQLTQLVPPQSQPQASPKPQTHSEPHSPKPQPHSQPTQPAQAPPQPQPSPKPQPQSQPPQQPKPQSHSQPTQAQPQPPQPQTESQLPTQLKSQTEPQPDSDQHSKTEK